MVNRNRVLEKEAANSLDSRYESKILHNQHKIKTELEIIRESQRMEEERQRKLEQEEEEILRKTLEISIIEAKDREIMLELEKKVENEALEKGKKE